MAKRPSTIRKLPDSLRAEVDRLLKDGRFTLTQVTDHLRAMGANVSRSAVGRYSQDFERLNEDIRLSREMATAMARELDSVEGDAGRLLIESLQALTLRARMQIAKDELDVEDVSYLARAAKDLQAALKSNIETEMKIRDRALREAAKAAAEVATSEGLSSSTIEAIKARILGVKKEAS